MEVKETFSETVIIFLISFSDNPIRSDCGSINMCSTSVTCFPGATKVLLATCRVVRCYRASQQKGWRLPDHWPLLKQVSQQGRQGGRTGEKLGKERAGM